MPDDLAPAWPCWRLVVERYVTWSDLERMSIDDVAKLCIAADIVFDAVNAPVPRSDR